MTLSKRIRQEPAERNAKSPRQYGENLGALITNRSANIPFTAKLLDVFGEEATIDRREERAARRTMHIAELRKRASEADAKLKRLHDAIENGVADLSDPMLKDRIAELKAIRDQARAKQNTEGMTDKETAFSLSVISFGLNEKVFRCR